MPDTSRELAIFNFQGMNVRTLDRDGEPWFYAVDVCAILGLSNVNRALHGLDDDEADLTSSKVRSSNGVVQSRDFWIISESGMYGLVFKSKKQQAVDFRRWIRRDVIPAIRRTGKYVAPDHIRQMLGLELERVELETEADRERWAKEDAIKRAEIAEEKVDRLQRQVWQLVCQHDKKDDGSCIHGRACTYVG